MHSTLRNEFCAGKKEDGNDNKKPEMGGKERRKKRNENQGELGDSPATRRKRGVEKRGWLDKSLFEYIYRVVIHEIILCDGN